MKPKPEVTPEMSSPYVVVRTASAGVHVGVLGDRTGEEVVLREARRIWYWKGANTLHEIALHGINKNGSKVSEATGQIILRGWIEILPCTEEAEKSLRGAAWTA